MDDLRTHELSSNPSNKSSSVSEWMEVRAMPQLPTLIGDDPYAFHSGSPMEPYPLKQSRWTHLPLKRIGNWLRKDGGPLDSIPLDHRQCEKQHNNPPDLACNPQISKRAAASLRRPHTFGGQFSEQIDKLCLSHACDHERRAVSLDRRRWVRKHGVAFALLFPKRSNSTLESNAAPDEVDTLSREEEPKPGPEHDIDSVGTHDDEPEGENPPIVPAQLSMTGPLTDSDDLSEAEDEQKLREELEAKWILNLSMHFRDRSEREKFFVTYAEEPNRWRRVTVTCDYRNVPQDSLEHDLKTLHYQRDKNARIYEAIRDSLPAIQFYDTVTNLKLQTTDRQLHVHVTEDVNEIVNYPPIAAVDHIRCKLYSESALVFESHLSGFVYKVRFDGQVYIKKEIPGPDNVDEFLYELNALYDLRNSKGVIPFIGIVVDDHHCFVKGLLISVASEGALVDIIYDEPDPSWMCRRRWARQIVHGLSEIHEGGFVQGDFTLSNIVVDAKKDAKVIDINRRGCPMGWEPPEMMAMIDSGQRISMYIGVKSDIFQLGMVLWALATMKDEPERLERPIVNLPCWHEADIPTYYRELVETCLSDAPQARLSAKELLRFFPVDEDEDFQPHIDRPMRVGHRADTEYIDPADEVSREDIERYQQRPDAAERSHVSTDGTTYIEAPPSPRYLFDSSGSYIVGQRRSPVGTSRLEPARRASLESLGGAEAMGPPPPDGQWEHVDAETFGRPYSNSDEGSATHGVQALRASRGRLPLLGRVADNIGSFTPPDLTASSHDIPSSQSDPAPESERSTATTGTLPSAGPISTFEHEAGHDAGLDETLAHTGNEMEPGGIPSAVSSAGTHRTANGASGQDAKNTSALSSLSQTPPEEDPCSPAERNALLDWAHRYVQRGRKTIKEYDEEQQRKDHAGYEEAAATDSHLLSDTRDPYYQPSLRLDPCPSCNRGCTHADCPSSSHH